MLSSELTKALAPFSKLTDAKAIRPRYRCLELSPSGIRGNAIFGSMERKIALPIKQPCTINGATFIAVVNSMATDEISLESGDNSLSWQCGAASGRLATVSLSSDDTVERINRRAKNAWKPGTDFAAALELGALSCDDRALAATGMYGVAIDLRSGSPAVLSTDGGTVSMCRFDSENLSNAPELLTFPPIALELLTKVLKPGDGALELEPNGCFYRDSDTQLLLVVCTAAKLAEARAVRNRFTDSKIVVPLPQSAIRAFVKRVEAMAEIKRFAHVTLSVKAGRMSLSFAETGAESEEYYLLDKQQKLPELPPIRLNADRLARALSSADEMVLDYLPKNALVLRGKDKPFVYCIAGKS